MIESQSPLANIHDPPEFGGIRSEQHKRPIPYPEPSVSSLFDRVIRLDHDPHFPSGRCLSRQKPYETPQSRCERSADADSAVARATETGGPRFPVTAG